MKRVIVILIICLGFIISCNIETETMNSTEEQQVLPENIESVKHINMNNESLNVFLSTNNTDKLRLNLEEVNLVEFKGDEGKYAFSIPLENKDKGLSEILFVYFLDSDLTNFKSMIHSVEVKEDYNDNNISIISVRSIDDNWFSKREFINGKEKLSLQKSTDAAPAECVIPQFINIDTNVDAYVSQAEWGQALNAFPVLSNLNFSDYDVDADGRISFNEYMQIDCFWTCVLCTLETLGCSINDTLCLLATYGSCGVSCI